MSAEASVAQEAEHAGISRMPMSPARPVDIQAVRPRRWREPNSDWRTVVRPPTKPSGDSPYIAPDLSGLKISADIENSATNNNNAFRIDVSLLRQKQGDSTPEPSALSFSASNDVACQSTNDKTTSPRLSISDSSVSTTPAAPKAPKLKPQLGKNDTRGRAAQARLSTSSSAIPVRATFQYPSAQAPSGNGTVQYRHRGEDPPGNGTVQYSPASPREELPPRPRTRRGREEDRRLSLETSEQPNGVAVTEHSDTVVHPPSGASRPRFRRPRTMYRVAACQDMSVYIKMATEERQSSTTETATTTETRRGLSGSDTHTGYAEVLKIAHGETQSRLASDSESTPGYSRVLFSEIPPNSENGVEENVQRVGTEPTMLLEDDKNDETNPYEYRNVTGSESEPTLLFENDRSGETNPYECRNVAGFDPDEYILDLFDQGRITAVQKRQAYSSGVEFPDSAYHIEQMFGLHGEQNALFLDTNSSVSTSKHPSYSFDDHARDLDLLVGAGNAHNTMDDIIYSYEHGGLGNGGTSGHRSVRDDDRAWSKLLVDLTEVEGLLESSEPDNTNVRGRRQGTQSSSSGRKKQKKAKKKGSTKKTANGTPERRKSTTELSSRVLDSKGTVSSPSLNELKLTPPAETKLTAMYSETPEARRYREVQGVNRYVTMMDNRKSILDQFGPDPTGGNKRKCAAKPRPSPRPHDPVSTQLEGTEEMYHADMPSEGGTPMTENTQNAIAFLYGDKETFERRPSGFFTNAAMDAELGELRRDLGDDWASDFMD